MTIENQIEISYQELQKSKSKINNVFNVIPSMFRRETMEYDVDIYNLFHQEIVIKIKESELHWASEVITGRITFNQDSDKELINSFNYGSGGWNEGFEAFDQLDVFQNAIEIIKTVFVIAEENKTQLKQLLDEYMVILKKTYALQGELSKIKNEEKHNKIEAEEKRIVESLGFVLETDGEKVINQLITNADTFYNTLFYVKVHVNELGNIRFSRVMLSAEKYQKTVFKINHSRISKKSLIETLEKEKIYVSDQITSNSLLWNTFKSVEDVKDFLKKNEES